MKDNKKIQLRINGAEFFIFKFYILLMSIMTIITVTIIANNFTIICSPCSSLTGVIRFLIVLYITFENSLLKFPSLTGVIRFLMKKNYSYNIYDAVSVPYRGYSFFNWIFQNLRTLILTSKGFRPLQGLFVF